MITRPTRWRRNEQKHARQRPGVCNALEGLLVHREIAGAFLPKVAEALRKEGVRMRPFGAGATDAAGSRLVEKPKPSIPRNIHDVEYNPSSMERSILAMM